MSSLHAIFVYMVLFYYFLLLFELLVRSCKSITQIIKNALANLIYFLV